MAIDTSGILLKVNTAANLAEKLAGGQGRGAFSVSTSGMRSGNTIAISKQTYTQYANEIMSILTKIRQAISAKKYTDAYDGGKTLQTSVNKLKGIVVSQSSTEKALFNACNDVVNSVTTGLFESEARLKSHYSHSAESIGDSIYHCLIDEDFMNIRMSQLRFGKF